jgi:RNA polymerase sigma factor (TIGR02999 family)
LTEAVYQELRRLASMAINRQVWPQTMQPTELLHEFYLEMQAAAEIDAECRAQFFALAAKTMRNILVDHARKRNAGKRDGGMKITLSELPAASGAVDVLEVHEALERFHRRYPRQAQLVELRFFGGLGAEEAVLALRTAGFECSLRTVERDWRFARAWLQNALR